MWQLMIAALAILVVLAYIEVVAAQRTAPDQANSAFLSAIPALK